MLCTRDLYGSDLNENRSKMDPLPCVRSLRLEDLRRGVSFPVGVAAWIYMLNYSLWRAGLIKSKSRCTVLLIFALQVYANLLRWHTFEELLVASCVSYTRNAPWLARGCWTVIEFRAHLTLLSLVPHSL